MSTGEDATEFHRCGKTKKKKHRVIEMRLWNTLYKCKIRWPPTLGYFPGSNTHRMRISGAVGTCALFPTVCLFPRDGGDCAVVGWQYRHLAPDPDRGNEDLEKNIRVSVRTTLGAYLRRKKRFVFKDFICLLSTSKRTLLYRILS